MLDMGFLPDVTTIVEATPDCRQTLLFSATIDQSIQKNLGSLLRDPAMVEIARNGETAKTVEQFMMPIKNFQKPELLHAVLDEKGSERVIVFARTKNRTEECAEELRNAGYSAESIHSDKSQGQRRRALENFRRGKTSVLVATDVLARGIDVPDVDHVINFDLPDMPEDYVHRIGRTGRAGEQGYAISFVTRENRRLLSDIEKLIDKHIPLMELETFELDLSLLEKPKKGERRGAGARSGKPKSSRSYGGNRHGGARRPGSGRSEFKGRSSERRQNDRPDGKRREGFERSEAGFKRKPSKNYTNAAKRVAKKQRAEAQGKKTAKKPNGRSTYDYSKFV